MQARKDSGHAFWTIAASGAGGCGHSNGHDSHLTMQVGLPADCILGRDSLAVGDRANHVDCHIYGFLSVAAGPAQAAVPSGSIVLAPTTIRGKLPVEACTLTYAVGEFITTSTC